MTLDKQIFMSFVRRRFGSDSGNGDWSNKKVGHAGKVFANLEVMIARPVCFHFASDGFDLCFVCVSVANDNCFEWRDVLEDLRPLANGIELGINTNASHLNLLSNLKADKHKLQTSLSVVVPAASYVLPDRIDKEVADFDSTIIAILNDLEIVLTYHSEGKARNDFSDDRVGDLFIINNDGVGVMMRSWPHEFNTNICQILSSLEVFAGIKVFLLVLNTSHDFFPVVD